MSVALNRLLYSVFFLVAIFYSMFSLSHEKITEPLLGFALLSLLILIWGRSRNIFVSIPFLLIFSAILMALFSWSLISVQLPDIADSSPRVESLTNKFVFVPVALILLGSQFRTLLFWSALGVGAILTPWLSGDGWVEVSRALDGARTGFGLHPITMGMIYGVGFLAITVFYRRLTSGRYRVVKSLLMMVLAVTFLFGVFASQTRAIYLAFMLILLAPFVAAVFLGFKHRARFRNYLVAFLLFWLLILVFGFLLYRLGFFDGFLSRVISELTIIEPLLRGDLSHIPRNSAGLRIHFWVDAWQMGMERFWMGWGEGGNHYLHEKAGNFFGQRHFITVHNDWLELFLAYGIWGVLLYGALIYWMSREVYLLWRDKQLTTDFFVFYLAFMVFFLVNGLFMSVLYFKESLLLWNVIMAGYLGFIFRYRYFPGDGVRVPDR